MRFCQIDRIIELQPGERIEAVKGLSLAEDYLQDHFPHFPVMPGVLMLEAMFQAGMWLVHATTDFACSSVTLAESNQVKFGDFVEPGSQLRVIAEWKKTDGDHIVMQTRGLIGESVAVRGKLVLDHFNLADREMAPPEIDEYLKQQRMSQFRRLQDPRNPYNSAFPNPDLASKNGRYRVNL